MPAAAAVHIDSGEALRLSRRAAGLTQVELAQRAGCSLAYVQMTERGYEPRDLSRSPKRRQIVAVLTEAGHAPYDTEPAGNGLRGKDADAAATASE